MTFYGEIGKLLLWTLFILKLDRLYDVPNNFMKWAIVNIYRTFISHAIFYIIKTEKQKGDQNQELSLELKDRS